MFTENLKLARAQTPTPNSSILVVYLCLKLGKWISPLVNSQYKLDTMVGDKAQGLLQRQKTKKSLG